MVGIRRVAVALVISPLLVHDLPALVNPEAAPTGSSWQEKAARLRQNLDPAALPPDRPEAAAVAGSDTDTAATPVGETESRENTDHLLQLWAESPPPDELQRRVLAALAAPSEHPGGALAAVPAIATAETFRTPEAPAGVGSAAWTPLFSFIHSGSRALAGRITSIARAFDPAQSEVIPFVGTVGGGLYKLLDLGIFAFWTPVSGTLPGSPSVGSFVVRPSNGNQILVGTGDYARYWGDGIYKTVDGGATWLRTAAPTATSVFRLRASWANDAEVFAATNSALLRSTNFGDTWTTVLSGVPVTDILQDPSTPSRWYAFETGTGVLLSTNGGETFQAFGGGCVGLPGGLHRSELAISAAAPNYVFAVVSVNGNLNGIYRSNDFGCHWTPIDSVDTISGAGQGYHAIAIAADPATPDRLFVGMANAQYTENATAASPCWVRNTGQAASDCGISWQISPIHSDQTDFLFTGGTHVWLSNDGGLFDYNYSSHTTADLGNDLGFNTLQQFSSVQDFAVGFSDPAFSVAGLQDHSVVAAQGTNAVQIGGGDGGRVSISPDDTDNIYFTVGLDWGRLLTADGGAHVSPIDCSLGDPGYGGVVRDPTPGLPSPLAFIFTTGTDGSGQNFLWFKPPTATCDWQKVSTTPLPLEFLSVDQANDPSLWALYVSGHDDRRVWVLDSGTPGSMIPADRTPPTIDPPLSGPDAHSRVFADRTGLRAGRIYYTTAYARPPRALLSENRGVTWKDVTGNLALVAASTNLNEMAGDPLHPATLFVATDAAVYRTDSADLPYPVWYRYMEGLPAVLLAQGLEVNLQSGGGDYLLRLGTYGAGFWERVIGPPSFIFADGFEAGSHIAWSAHFP